MFRSPASEKEFFFSVMEQSDRLRHIVPFVKHFTKVYNEIQPDCQV